MVTIENGSRVLPPKVVACLMRPLAALNKKVHSRRDGNHPVLPPKAAVSKGRK